MEEHNISAVRDLLNRTRYAANFNAANMDKGLRRRLLGLTRLPNYADDEVVSISLF